MVVDGHLADVTVEAVGIVEVAAQDHVGAERRDRGSAVRAAETVGRDLGAVFEQSRSPGVHGGGERLPLVGGDVGREHAVGARALADVEAGGGVELEDP